MPPYYYATTTTTSAADDATVPALVAIAEYQHNLIMPSGIFFSFRWKRWRRVGGCCCVRRSAAAVIVVVVFFVSDDDRIGALFSSSPRTHNLYCTLYIDALLCLRHPRRTILLVVV